MDDRIQELLERARETAATAGVYDAHRGSTGGEDALEQVFSELDHKEAAAAELRSRLERLRQEKPL